MTATLTFQTRTQAEAFATAWTRHTKTGNMIGAGTENVVVTVYDVSESYKFWIDDYIFKINQ